MNHLKTTPLQKTVVSAAIAAALSLSATTTFADIYEFTFNNGECTTLPLPVGSCTGPGDGLFTMLTSAGAPLQNTSYPYYGDTTWGYGKRTQMGGLLSYDATQRTGAVSINPFDFYNGGPAAASSIVFTKEAASNLMPAQMLFAWNGSTIATEVVWDGSGMIAALPGIAINDTIDLASCTGGSLDGLCALPASNGMKGSLPIGATPVATSTYNVTGVVNVVDIDNNLVSTSGVAALGVDDGIGGSPMDNGPFDGFNANFDFASLTLTGYNDTTAPELSFSTNIITIDLNGSFDANSPGVTVSCSDNADGSGTLTPAGSTNASLTFTVNAGDLAAIDSSVSGVYPVRYSCTDSAGSRTSTAVTNDPNNPGNALIPSDNVSSDVSLNVIVADPSAPVISITNDGQPTQHEACTVYNDDGATVTDIEDDDAVLTAAIVVDDVDSIIGQNLPAGTADANILYDVTDLGNNPVTLANPSGGPLDAVTRTRTVTVVDTTGPIITIPGFPLVTIESSLMGTYSNPTATAVDALSDCSPVIGGAAVTADSVDFMVPAGLDSVQTTLKYFASDSAVPANQTQKDLTVIVERSEPVITLIGDGVLLLEIGDTYVEQGMDIHDVQDGDLTDVITTGSTQPSGSPGGAFLDHTIDSSAVDTAVEGSYEVLYNVDDSDGNAATQLVRTVVVGAYAENSNFTMLDAGGLRIGGTNDVVMVWDEVSYNTDESDNSFFVQIVSEKPEPFKGFPWFAHHVRLFEGPVAGETTYSFNTGCSVAELEATGCPVGSGTPGETMTMTVKAGQIGAHMLFDWNVTTNIDVVNVWDKNAVWDDHGDASPKNAMWTCEAGTPPDPTAPFKLISTDYNADGINSSPMVDGPFKGFYANFNMGPSAFSAGCEVISTSAPDTKLGSGALSWSMLLGIIPLVAFFRKRIKL